MPSEDPKPGRSVLTRELSEFLVELSVALHRHSMYPSGHPSLGPAVDAIVRRGRLVHVCDVYDALSTTRPYRDAWPSEKTMAYLEERAGTEFDPDLVTGFIRTLRDGEAQVRVLSEQAAAS